MDIIERIYRVNLGVKKGERVFIISDCYSSEIEDIAQLFLDVGKKLGFDTSLCKYQPTGCHGIEPPKVVWEEAEKNLPDVLISITHFSTSHTDFRRMLTKKGTRYVSMPLFTKDMLKTPMDVDYEEMEKLGRKIKMVLQKGDEVSILSKEGTDLRFKIKGRKVFIDSGILREKGSFGNLPAGEVFLAPVEGTTKGILVISVMEKRRLKEPVYAKIEEGMVVRLSGEEEGITRLNNIFSNYPLARNIAEFGIGINKKAKNPCNVLEAEKILGTVHIAFGDNKGFGGEVSTPFHEDYVVFLGTVKIDEMVILKKWRLMI
ncbi:TPA: leucyl aminopeptidase [bacterium]|nr:leucyl aminopeptidase [bacterium]